MRRSEPGLPPQPVGDALDNAAGHRPSPVVLERVHELVREDALDLVPDARTVAVCAVGDALEVREREVDLLVVVVEVRAAGVGDAVKGVQVQGDGADGGRRRGRVGRVQEAEDVRGGEREDGSGRGRVLEEDVAACVLEEGQLEW